MSSLHLRTTKNIPKMGGVTAEKIYSYENVPVLSQKSKGGDILPDLTAEDMEILVEKKLSKAVVTKFAAIMVSIFC